MHKCGKIRRIAKWHTGRTSLDLILMRKTISLILPSWKLVETRTCVCSNCKGKYERLIKITTSITDHCCLSSVYILKTFSVYNHQGWALVTSWNGEQLSFYLKLLQWLIVLCNETQFSSSFLQRSKSTLSGSALLTRTAPLPVQKPPLVELKQIYGKN